MVFGQASFTDFWEINFGLIVLISFLCHQSGVLSFGLHTSSKPVISSAWHFDLFWQSTRHIKWNDLLFCECSLAWVNKSLREIKKSLSKVSPQAIFGFPWVNIHIVTKIDQSFHLTHRVNCGKWSPVFTGILSQNGLWKLLPKGSQSETKEVPETAQRVFLTSAKGRKQLILVQGVSVWLWRRMMLLAAVKFPVFDAFLKNSEEMTGLLGVRRLNDKILSVSDSSPSKCKSDTSSFTVTMLTAAKKNQNNRLGAAASSQKKKQS